MFLVEASFVEILCICWYTTVFQLVFSCCFYIDVVVLKELFTLCPGPDQGVGSGAVFHGIVLSIPETHPSL